MSKIQAIASYTKLVTDSGEDGLLKRMKNRGASDIFIACCDGFSGFPQAIETVYPKTQVQLCIVHMVRKSMTYVSWKHRKQAARDLRAIY